MDVGVWVVVGAVALTCLLAVLAGVAFAARRRVERALARAQADLAELRARVDALAARPTEQRRAEASDVPPLHLAATDYVITEVGTAPRPPEPTPVPDRAVLSVTLGEPLVKVVAFGYGVRRALSPETRNRVAFEMRRELKRARKERRRGARQARREAAA